MRVPRNYVLSALPKEDADWLGEQCEFVELPSRQVFYREDEEIGHVHFLESGLASLVVPLETGTLVEVGVIGFEGLTGLPAALGVERTKHRSMMQLSGSAFRCEASVLREQMRTSRALMDGILLFCHQLNVQISQTAVCNARHNVQQRLARWLLMAADRIDSDQVPLTHRFFAMMLGVRRAGITVAAGRLQSAGAIAYSRGQVVIEDRARLEEAACECYRAVKLEKKRCNAFPAAGSRRS